MQKKINILISCFLTNKIYFKISFDEFFSVKAVKIEKIHLLKIAFIYINL